MFVRLGNNSEKPERRVSSIIWTVGNLLETVELTLNNTKPFVVRFLLHFSGTIGLLGKKSPPFFILGRSMKSQIAYLRETRTFFYVDQQNKKVFIDFGNSLPINSDGSMSTSHYGDLYVALPKGEHPKLDCSDELMWIGGVDYKLPQWYRSTSGIQTFPVKGSFSTQEMTKLQNSPLLVVEVSR